MSCAEYVSNNFYVKTNFSFLGENIKFNPLPLVIMVNSCINKKKLRAYTLKVSHPNNV